MEHLTDTLQRKFEEISLYSRGDLCVCVVGRGGPLG